MRKLVITELEECAPEKNQEFSEEFQHRAREGLCPQCGAKGDFIGCKAVCPTHGPYDFLEIGDKRKFVKENDLEVVEGEGRE